MKPINLSPVRLPEVFVENVCDTEAGTEADVEDKDVDVVGGIIEVGVSEYQYGGFTSQISEVLQRKRLAKKIVSEGVVDTSHLSHCEFANLQHLPLPFLLEFFC